MTSRPAALGKKLSLESKSDADAALHELAWLNQQAGIITQRTQQAVNKITADAADKLQFELEGEQVTFADRSKALNEALESWCKTRLSKHLEGKAKSITLAHGVLGRKSLPDVLTYDEQGVMAAVEKKAGLAKLLQKLGETALGALTLGGVIRFEAKIDKRSATTLWKAGGRGQKTLAALGMKIDEGREALVIEPAALEVAAPSA